MGPKIQHKLLFLKLFGHRRDIPAKSRDIQPKKFDFPGFEGLIEPFGPLPLHVGGPHPTGRYPDPKVRVCAHFACLIFGRFYPISRVGPNFATPLAPQNPPNPKTIKVTKSHSKVTVGGHPKVTPKVTQK